MTQRTTRNSRRAAGVEHPFTIISGTSTSRTQSPPNLPTPAIMSSASPESAHIDPMNYSTLEPTSVPTPQEQEATAFIKAIYMIIKGNDSGSKHKLQEPDPFDGSDSQKLRTFILQCKLNFRDCLDPFQDDKFKVNYVLSYLKGTALYCFKSVILDPD